MLQDHLKNKNNQFLILRPNPTYGTVARSLRARVGVSGTLSDSPDCCGSNDVLETWLAAVLRIFCHGPAGEVGCKSRVFTPNWVCSRPEKSTCGHF
jgi:hypothetical protein